MKVIEKNYPIILGSSGSTSIGLDLSMTSTGVGIINGGTLKTVRIKTEPEDGSDYHRILAIQDIIHTAIHDYCFDEPKCRPRILVEGYAMGVRGSRVFTMGELGGTIKMGLLKRGHAVMDVPPNNVKLFTTGKGVGDKTAITMALYKKYNIEIQQNDEADATALAIMNHLIFEGEEMFPLLEYQKRAKEGISLLSL